jgi:hypothetical protein
MSGAGFILGVALFVLVAGGWVERAIDAYDRRTAALRQQEGT